MLINNGHDAWWSVRLRAQNRHACSVLCAKTNFTGVVLHQETNVMFGFANLEHCNLTNRSQEKTCVAMQLLVRLLQNVCQNSVAIAVQMFVSATIPAFVVSRQNIGQETVGHEL